MPKMFKTSSRSELSEALFQSFPGPVPEGPERSGRAPEVHRVLPEDLHENGDGPDHHDEKDQEEDEGPEKHDLLGDLLPSLPQRLRELDNPSPQGSLHGRFHRVGS